MEGARGEGKGNRRREKKRGGVEVREAKLDSHAWIKIRPGVERLHFFFFLCVCVSLYLCVIALHSRPLSSSNAHNLSVQLTLLPVCFDEAVERKAKSSYRSILRCKKKKTKRNIFNLHLLRIYFQIWLRHKNPAVFFFTGFQGGIYLKNCEGLLNSNNRVWYLQYLSILHPMFVTRVHSITTFHQTKLN